MNTFPVPESELGNLKTFWRKFFFFMSTFYYEQAILFVQINQNLREKYFGCNTEAESNTFRLSRKI